MTLSLTHSLTHWVRVLLLLTYKERPQRRVTFETLDQSDEETWGIAYYRSLGWHHVLLILIPFESYFLCFRGVFWPRSPSSSRSWSWWWWLRKQKNANERSGKLRRVLFTQLWRRAATGSTDYNLIKTIIFSKISNIIIWSNISNIIIWWKSSHRFNWL